MSRQTLLSGASELCFPFLAKGSQFQLRIPIFPCKKVYRKQNMEALERREKKLGIKIFSDISGRILEV